MLLVVVVVVVVATIVGLAIGAFGSTPLTDIHKVYLDTFIRIVAVSKRIKYVSFCVLPSVGRNSAHRRDSAETGLTCE